MPRRGRGATPRGAKAAASAAIAGGGRKRKSDANAASDPPASTTRIWIYAAGAEEEGGGGNSEGGGYEAYLNRRVKRPVARSLGENFSYFAAAGKAEESAIDVDGDDKKTGEQEGVSILFHTFSGHARHFCSIALLPVFYAVIGMPPSFEQTACAVHSLSFHRDVGTGVKFGGIVAPMMFSHQ